MLALPCHHKNLTISATSIHFQKELVTRKSWMHPASHARRGSTVSITRYLIQPVAGQQLPCYDLARVVLTRALQRAEPDLKLLVSLGSNGRGGFLLEVPEDSKTEQAMVSFLTDLDNLAA